MEENEGKIFVAGIHVAEIYFPMAMLVCRVDGNYIALRLEM